MRLSGFIVGGLLGAAAAMYASRKRPGMTGWAVEAAGGMVSSAKNKLVGKVMERKLNQWGKEAVHEAPKPSAASAESSADAWRQIGALVESDPALKRETQAIMQSAVIGSSDDKSIETTKH